MSYLLQTIAEIKPPSHHAECRKALRNRLHNWRYLICVPPVSDYLSGNSISMIGTESRRKHGLVLGV